MARLSDDDLERIIAEQMPGYTVVSRGDRVKPEAVPPETDGVAADIHELRERYLDEPAPDAAARGPELDPGAEADELIVTVGPTRAADAINPDTRKQVIVSASTGQIIGSQG
jgi:hypothetical protein